MAAHQLPVVERGVRAREREKEKEALVAGPISDLGL